MACTHRLPAPLYGETEEEYTEKYKMFINPVLDPSKYPHIRGKAQVRVYVDGVFDMFHFGHAQYIMQARNMFPNCYVIAGVAAGSTTLELKGQTIMTEQERCDKIRMCRFVDEVMCPAPWTLSLGFLNQHDIDFVVQNDAPYPMGDIPDIYQPIKDQGRFLPVIRTPSVSTSDYITRIVSSYDAFLQRYLTTGYSRDDLNITYLKEKQLEVRRHVEGVGRTINSYITGFLEHFYQPISHRIVSFISPNTSPNVSPCCSEDEEEEEEGRKKLKQSN